MGALYLWQPELQQRKTSLLCPEKPERVTVLMPGRLFAKAQVSGRQLAFGTRTEEILSPVHDADYIARVRDAHHNGVRYLDAGETEVTADIFDQALWSASAGVEAVERVLAGEAPAAFCAIRPPGHHANRYRALGFCVFNNAAAAAAHARRRLGVERVLIVDWDVHPGNGTQEIFFDDPSVFTLSIHQADLFPEAGREELTGRGPGQGYNRNVPVRGGSPLDEYLARFEAEVRETAGDFRPNLLIISAGFDAHRADPASRLGLDEDAFARMTEIVLEATRPHTGGRTVSLLEGGYQLAALEACVAAHFRALCNQSG